MSTPLDVRRESTTGSAETTIPELAALLTRTLPEDGMDRMTVNRLEEVLAVPALTAHL